MSLFGSEPDRIRAAINSPTAVTAIQQSQALAKRARKRVRRFRSTMPKAHIPLRRCRQSAPHSS